MSDIVERLRSKYVKLEDCREGADEIERLRELLETAGISSKKPRVVNINLHNRGLHYDFLTVFSIHKDMTADEAAEYLGIPVGGYGWWAKVSDLKILKYIEWTKEKRKSRRGGSVEVYRITDKGIDALSEVNQSV